MRSTPLWFDTEGYATSGWFTFPSDGVARGSVVVCPPIATELISAHDTLRQLAERLASQGFAVLRMHYPGAGDAADVADLNAVDVAELCKSSIISAVELMRRTGTGWVAAVGMRMGANILGSIPQEHLGLDAAVYWDPCPTAAGFFRQQQRAFKLYFPSVDLSAELPGSTTIPGYVYPATVVEQLRRLELRTIPDDASTTTLVLTRRESGGTPLRDAIGDGATWLRVAGQPELLDIRGTESVIPEATVAMISDRLGDLAPEVGSRLQVFEVGSASAKVTADGTSERGAHLGPLGLFGIVTEPADPRPGAPLVVFINTAAEVHIGPARQWVVLARTLATYGFTSVRMDLSGMGDSPSRPGQRDRTPYRSAVPDDVIDVVRALCPDDASNVVLVGLCSGAVAAMTTGVRLGAAGVVAINPAPTSEVADFLRELEGSRLAVDASALQGRRLWLGGRMSDVKARWRSRLPTPAWRIAHTLRLWRSAAADFEQIAERVGQTLILCGPEEGVRYDTRGRWILRRLARARQFEFRIVADLDHSLLTPPSQRRVVAAVVDRLDGWFPATEPKPVPVIPEATPEVAKRRGRQQRRRLTSEVLG